MKYIKYVAIFLLCLLFAGCNPDSIEMEIFTSDLQDAVKNVVLIPSIISFTSYSGNKDDSTQAIIDVAKKYIGADAEITTNKGDFGSAIVIKCKIPMANKDVLDPYLQQNPYPFALVMEGTKISFQKTDSFDRMNDEIKESNAMMTIDLPAKETKIKLIGDLPKGPTISAIAVFADEKPELQYSAAVDKRQSVQLQFSGDKTNVYSEIPPQFDVAF